MVRALAAARRGAARFAHAPCHPPHQGVEKLVASKMVVEGSNRRIHSVDRHAGLAVAGLGPDGRQLVHRARAEASRYNAFYGDRIPAQVLAERLASFVHLYTLYWSVRPFGASVLLACADVPAEGEAEPSSASLFAIDTGGEVYRFFGTALGKGRQQAKTELERLKLSELSCRDALLELAKIIHRCHDEKDKAFELELSWVCAESGWEHARVPADLARATGEAAKAAIEAALMDEN